LHCGVKEGVQRTHLNGYITLAVEVDRKILSQRRGFLFGLTVAKPLARKLLLSYLVSGQSNSILK
jgi:hypothetical protein